MTAADQSKIVTSQSGPVDFISRECYIQSQGEPVHATLDISRPISIEDFFYCAGGPRARLQEVDVLFLVIHLNARLSFETLAQLAVLEENTVLDEANLHNPRLVRVLLAVHHPGGGGLTQTNEVSEDQVRWLADMLTGGRLVIISAKDTETTTQLVEDVAGEVLTARAGARDGDTTPAASVGSAGAVPRVHPPADQAAQDAQTSRHKGLKNGEWVRRIFGRT